MDRYREGQRASCPFLIPKTSLPLKIIPVPVYCRLPNGRARIIPARDELTTLCSADHYRDCTSFRRWDPK